MKKFIVKSSISLTFGLLLALLFCWMRGLFSADSISDKYKYICDGFFVAAGLLIGFGVLAFCSNGGTFDMLAFGTKKVFGSIFVSRKKLDRAPKKTFADYREERMEKTKPFLHLLLSGTILLINAIIFLILYFKVTP